MSTFSVADRDRGIMSDPMLGQTQKPGHEGTGPGKLHHDQSASDAPLTLS